jgi:hypothetical protein
MKMKKHIVIIVAVADIAIFSIVLGTMNGNKPESSLPIENAVQTDKPANMKDKPEKSSIAEEIAKAEELFLQEKYEEARDILMSVRLIESNIIKKYRSMRKDDLQEFSQSEFHQKDLLLQKIATKMLANLMGAGAFIAVSGIENQFSRNEMLFYISPKSKQTRCVCGNTVLLLVLLTSIYRQIRRAIITQQIERRAKRNPG